MLNWRCRADAPGGGAGKGAAPRTAVNTLPSRPGSPDEREMLANARPPDADTPKITTTVPRLPGPGGLRDATRARTTAA